MEDTFVKSKRKRVSGERCLICSNPCDNPLKVCLSLEAFKSLVGSGNLGENECMGMHLLSIFILRRILNYSKSDCEDVLKRMTGLNPGEWFQLCEDCSKVVEKVLESLQQIMELEKKVDKLKKLACGKMQESLRLEGGKTGDRKLKKILARNVIRDHFQSQNDCKKVGNGFEKDVEEFTVSRKKSRARPLIYDDDSDGSPDPVNIPESIVKDLSSNDYSEADENEPHEYKLSKASKRIDAIKAPANASQSTERICDPKDIYKRRRLEHPRITRKSLKKGSARYPKNYPINKSTSEAATGNPSSTVQPCLTLHSDEDTVILQEENISQETKGNASIEALEVDSAPLLIKSQPDSDHNTRKLYFRCGKCGFECSNTKQKTLHISQHSIVDHVVKKTSENKFQCNFCTKVFSSIEAVSSHVKDKHTKAMKWKPYKCHSCEDSFKFQAGLNAHVKLVHENVREIQCEKCGAVFRKFADLTGHYAAFHLEKKEPEICDLCGKRASSKESLQNHKRRFHGSTYTKG